MSKIDDAKKLLEELQVKVPDINDLAISRTNGLVIFSLQRVATDTKSERMLGGMASALYSISKRSADELIHGDFKSLNVEIDKGNIFLIYTGKVILIAITKPEPNLGLLTLELEDSAKKLNEIFI